MTFSCSGQYAPCGEKRGVHECCAKAVVRLEATLPRLQCDWVSEPGSLHQGKRSMRKALQACTFPKGRLSKNPKRRGIVRGGCNSAPMSSVFADQTSFHAANSPKTCLNVPPFQKDLFLLSGFSSQNLKKKVFSAIQCRLFGRGSGAPMKTKCVCVCVCSRRKEHLNFLLYLCQVLTHGHD